MKAKPTRLKILDGDRGNIGMKKLKKKLASEPDVELPDCPRHLSREAKKEWRRITLLLYAQGMISKTDRATIAAYCQTYARWVQAEREIKKTGAIIKAPSGYPIQNPWLPIANKNLELMRKFLSEMGMTPSSRSRLPVKEPPTSDDPLEDLLSGIMN